MLNKHPAQPEKGPKTETRRLEKELQEIKQTYNKREAARLTRDIILELKEIDSPLQSNKTPPAERKVLDQETPLRRHLLPGIGDLSVSDQKQETYDKREWENRYWETKNFRVCWVRQGNIITAPRNKTPHTIVSMSECSFIVGTTDEKMISAHISYSLQSQVEAVLEHLDKHNVKPENRYVVANTDNQKESSRPEPEPAQRLSERREY
jgi:hypothetical protein